MSGHSQHLSYVSFEASIQAAVCLVWVDFKESLFNRIEHFHLRALVGFHFIYLLLFWHHG